MKNGYFSESFDNWQVQILLCRETLVIAVQRNIIEIVEHNYLLINTGYLCVIIYSYVSPVFILNVLFWQYPSGTLATTFYVLRY